MRGGVCCHLGRSAASVSYSGPCDGVVVENAHAEVRTREDLEDCAGRNAVEAVDSSDRIGRFEAIVASNRREEVGQVMSSAWSW